MRTLSHTSRTFDDDLAAFCRGAVVSRELSAGVAAILAAVSERGDEAVGYYAAKFDGAAQLVARTAEQYERVQVALNAQKAA